MNYPEAVHVRQTGRNVNQLNRSSVRFCGAGDRGAYKFGAVRMFVLSNELDDVPMFHPLGDHREPVSTYRHSEQW